MWQLYVELKELCIPTLVWTWVCVATWTWLLCCVQGGESSGEWELETSGGGKFVTTVVGCWVSNICSGTFIFSIGSHKPLLLLVCKIWIAYCTIKSMNVVIH